MPKPENESCSTCRFFIPPATAPDAPPEIVAAHYGACHIHAPTAQIRGWPWVSHADWCGDWKPVSLSPSRPASPHVVQVTDEPGDSAVTAHCSCGWVRDGFDRSQRGIDAAVLAGAQHEYATRS